MIQDPDRLAALAAAPATRVEQTPFAELLLAHQWAGSTLVLDARRGRVEKRVVLERGVPVDCRSNLVHETLSRYLVEIGRIPPEVSASVLASSAAKGMLFGEALVAEGGIDATELTRLLQQNLAKKLLDLFTWPDGEIQVDSGPLPPFSALKVKVPQLVLTGVTRFMPQAAIERALSPLAGAQLARSPRHEALRDDLRLGPRETEALEALARPSRIEDLMQSTARGADEIARSLYALLLLGLAVRAQDLKAPEVMPEPPQARAARPVTAAPAEVVAPPAAAPRTTAKEERAELDAAARLALRNRVAELFLSHRQKDPFDLLQLSEEAPLGEIQERYLAFAEELAPWRFGGPELAAAADYARELFLAGAAAYARLTDPESASSLRLERRMKREAAARESRASFQRIDTDLLDPAVQFRKGLALLESGKLPAALQQLEFAADCDPQNGAYRAEVARCRFRISPESNGARVLDELREAQRVAPKSVEPLLYFGEIAGELGRFDDAEESLRRAAKLLGPQDRRALDALHALAGQRKKKR
jgi:tetratricopeptide (TPR) repeat protein